jgi:hypothetical protein
MICNLDKAQDGISFRKDGNKTVIFRKSAHMNEQVSLFEQQDLSFWSKSKNTSLALLPVLRYYTRDSSSQHRSVD